MSFSSLTIDVDKFRATDSELFNASDYTNEEIIALGQLNGKERLKLDCYELFKLTNLTDPTTELDGYVIKYELQFKRALMLIQLHEFYKGRSGEIGELNYERSKQYLKEYESFLQTFRNFYTNTNNVSKMLVYTIG